MGFSFCSFASGSSGNCYMVESDSTTLLVDVGIAGKRILAGLEENGLQVENINGILLTHEHIDHVRSIRIIGRKASQAEIYGSEGTFSCIEDKLPPDRTHPLTEDEPFDIGDITVMPFDLSHDALEPMGYSFVHDGRQLTIVTDTGYVPDDIFDQIRGADTLVLEANHEVNILRMGSYPYPLQQRILGEEGHLSNETAGNTICHMLDALDGKKTPKVVLAHLSNENNTPEQAYLTVKNILFENDYYVDRDLELSVVRRDDPSPLIEV
ncbi:MAG: MBL fold metallo-hydrolase [Clostridiales bacterium]|nr:MBL fold metallo-hydrolase [Clostridiales bacterium]